MTLPSVTVVIPTRNRVALLEEAVASVKGQTLVDWELIVVDDASDDGTWAWLETLVDTRIKKVRLQRHSERSAARNRGLAQANGEFVLFLDDDDRLRPRALERLHRRLVGWPEAVAVVGRPVVFDEFGHRRRAMLPWISVTRRILDEVLAGWVGVAGQCLYRVATLRRCGGWNEHLAAAEDQDLWLRVARLGPVGFIPWTVLEIRVHAGQWRAADVAAIEEGIRRSFVAGLIGATRRECERVLSARALLATAVEAYQHRQFARALSFYKRAAHQAPRLFYSPVVGPMLASLILKTLVGLVVGREVFERSRALKAAVRRLLRRDPVAKRGPETVQSAVRASSERVT